MKTTSSLLTIFALTACPAAAVSIGQGREAQTATGGANPIRKVVTMLQMMAKKVEAEGEKEKELFEKYMCYCKSSGGALEKSIADANTKVPDLQSQIEEAESKKAQLEDDVKQHQADRAAAVEAMKEATATREKEKAAFEKETAELKSYLEAIKKAIAALTGGVGKTRGSLAGAPDAAEKFSAPESKYAGPAEFLQTRAAGVLRRLVMGERPEMNEADREDLLAFLGEGSPAAVYVPSSGQIIGILKQLWDEMDADLNGALSKEEAAVAAYEELMAAKTKEKEILTQMIEDKLQRIADLGVKIAEMKNDLTDTQEALIEDTKFLADLEKNCATKTKEWEEICKMRSEELLALQETIKILNDDDALELFKKTLPSPSLVQLQVTVKDMRRKALQMLKVVSSTTDRRAQLDMIALALHGNKIGFEKVIKMIDDMVETLKKEQVDDDSKKEYCSVQLDTADDKKKELEKMIADLETAIAADTEGVVTLTAEIDALEDSIKALDKAVAEATEQRKQENEDYTELMASDSAAKEVIAFAKNRLNKFYNPAMYKPPPKRELTEEERITVNMGGTLAPTNPPAGIAGTGIAALASISAHEAPPPPPEAPKAYTKKTEESNGVLAMMDLLVKDLDKEMTVATAEEKDAQADYEQMMIDSAEQRAESSKAMTDKEAAKAQLESALQAKKESKAGSTKELAATLEYIASLHAECDWLLKFYDQRKEARASEIDALGNAKAVLSGASYSLIQTGTTAARARGHLRGQ